jgi:hypothetical protein
MRAGGGPLALGAAGSIAAASPLRSSERAGGGGIPSWLGLMLYSSMKHRTQLYLDDGQYRWLKQRAGASGSIAAVVRELIDAERARRADPLADPLLRYLVDEAPGRGREATSVATLDRDLYGE